jgi:hypothetical protein
MPLVGDRVRLAHRPPRSFRRPLRRRLFHASAHAPAAAGRAPVDAPSSCARPLQPPPSRPHSSPPSPPPPPVAPLRSPPRLLHRSRVVWPRCLRSEGLYSGQHLRKSTRTPFLERRILPIRRVWRHVCISLESRLNGPKAPKFPAARASRLEFRGADRSGGGPTGTFPDTTWKRYTFFTFLVPRAPPTPSDAD